jgi:prepilin-type N-terminal cleavage/methylation domain-containing protein
MTALTARRRTGATLVELLVAMSIIAGLAALALMMMPSITNKDMTLKGTAEVQSTLKIAQGMAASSRLPRGVRLLVNQAGGTLSYEIQ